MELPNFKQESVNALDLELPLSNQESEFSKKGTVTTSSKISQPVTPEKPRPNNSGPSKDYGASGLHVPFNLRGVLQVKRVASEIGASLQAIAAIVYMHVS